MFCYAVEMYHHSWQQAKQKNGSDLRAHAQVQFIEK